MHNICPRQRNTTVQQSIRGNDGKGQAIIDGKISALNININNRVGKYYTNTSSVWECLRAKALMDTQHHQNESRLHSCRISHGHQTRTDVVLSKDWTLSTDFLNVALKHVAKNSVLRETKKSSRKEMLKVEVVISGVVSEISKRHGLNEGNTISEDMQNKLRVVESVTRSASTYIRSLERNISSASTELLTRITTVLAPNHIQYQMMSYHHVTLVVLLD